MKVWLRSLKQHWLPTLFVLAVLGAVTTYLVAINSEGSVGRQSGTIWLLLVVNLVLLLGIAAVYARRIFGMWGALYMAMTRSKLQKRIVLVFGVVTVLPTLVVSLFSFFFFNLGIQTWFNERVQITLQESLSVAESYLAEHKDSIRADALAMAGDLNRVADLAYSDPLEFNRLVSGQASVRFLTEALVFQRNRIIAQGRLSFELAFESMPQEAIERASSGEVVILSDEDSDKVRAMVKLDAIPDAYLVVGRLLDSKVQGYTDKAKGAYNDYTALRQNLHRLQFAFSLVFFAVALLLLLSAVWYALLFATKLTTPITTLANAAARIGDGDFSVRVDASGSEDEITTLTRTFNRMATQLEAQQGELITANRHLDERRRLTEAVLAGVSAGVIALDRDRTISVANPSAEALLREEGAALVGRHVQEVLPQLTDMLSQAESSEGITQGDIILQRGETTTTLHARIVTEEAGKQLAGFVVTFDDITPLISAQRQAAWSDVARRIAHEIKNPLTPIALSAERLKRKYSKLAGEDEEAFTKYTDTIAQHVGNIGRMVDEFVGFARLPTPQMRAEILQDILRKNIFAEKIAHPHIEYQLHMPDEDVVFVCDERQITQAILNLLKNAAEAMESAEIPEQRITVGLASDARRITLEIRDSGTGFTQANIEQCFEPYITSRAKGTGLGLSITKKIIEDHKGTITLANHPEGGAHISVVFAVA